MIRCWHRILVPIGRPDRERDEFPLLTSFTEVSNHLGKLHQKLPSLHHLLVVEPDVEIAAHAVDVRF